MPHGRIVHAITIEPMLRKADLDENSFKKQTSVHANNERKGPPFRLAFASTVYKAQGHTLLRAIGDLKGMIASYNHRRQLYVMLSRVKKGDYILLAHLASLKPVKLWDILVKIDWDMQAELVHEKKETDYYAELRTSD
eukprot:tig00000764_g3981.t1